MRALHHAPRPSAAGLVALVLVSVVLGAEAFGRQVPEVEIPSDRDLLRDRPFDRLKLIDGTELIVDPVHPRPLPDREELRAAERRRKDDDGFERVGGLLVRRPPELKRDPRENSIRITTQEEEPREYYVKLTSIQQVDYFEDILLADALRRARSGDFAMAFELVLAVQARDPTWQGLGDTADHIALLEGQEVLSRGLADEGLRLLSELYRRSPEFPGLAPLLAKAYIGRVDSAFDQGAFAVGRRTLAALREMTPEDSEVSRLERRFTTRAQRLAEQAERLTGADRTERLAEAVSVWPNDEELADRYRSAFLETPVLEVIVQDIPRRPGPFVECRADARLIDLLYRPILSDTSEEATRGERPGQLAEGLETTDIGRRLRLRLKEGIFWNDGSRAIGAADIARALSDRALPSTIGFDARWADLLARVSPIGDLEVEVILKRAALNPAAWLTLPVGPAHAGRDGLVWTPDGPRPIGSGPYTMGPLTEASVRLDRAEVTDSGTVPIARIIERRLDPRADPVAALRRGDASLLESVPLAHLDELTEDPEIRLGRYRSHRMHWIALDGRNPVLRNRSLRRGLSFAIAREDLLREQVLQGPLLEGAIPSDGPFPVGSFANAADVAPLEHDRLLARMLVRAALQEMGLERVELTFAYPATPEARAVVPVLVNAFADAGVVVSPVEWRLSDLERDLRRGARFDLAYRIAQVDDPILDAGPVLCPGYLAPPEADGLGALASPRMLELLLQLEQVQDLPTAREQLLAIDREARDELPILPLWQLPKYYAWRSRLVGPTDEADELYDGIESWTIEPWLPSDAR